MNLLDKVLLGSLVILLPIGFVISSRFLTDDKNEAEVQGATVDAQKLQAAINDAVRNNQPKLETPKPISISEVTYASESGVFKMKGKAPNSNSNVVMSVTVLPPNGIEPDAETGTVQGLEVETISVVPESNGGFLFEQLIEKDQQNGIVEIRLEQNDSVKTVRFDLAKKKQVL